jgi:Invasion associated locus B (IalB) protein
MPRLQMTLPAVSLIVAAAFALTPAVLAQTTGPSDVSAQAKTKKQPTAKRRAPAKKKSSAKSAPKKKSAPSTQASVNPTEPTLVGQYGDWGAYTATPGGKKVCFALSKPKSQQASKDDVKRDSAYIFVATRPSERVKDEISVIVGYPLNGKVDATAQVGSSTFVMFGQNDGAWIKNAAEEPRLVEAMRKGAELVIKGKSSRGTETTDTYSLMGITNALERVAKECGGSG